MQIQTKIADDYRLSYIYTDSWCQNPNPIFYKSIVIQKISVDLDLNILSSVCFDVLIFIKIFDTAQYICSILYSRSTIFANPKA